MYGLNPTMKGRRKMFKKLFGIAIALCMLTSLATTCFAKDDIGEIEKAKKAIRNGIDTVELYNDITPEAFLKKMETLLPEGSEVTLSFVKESDFRIWNATSQKDGSIFANIKFTSDVYTRQDMYTVTLPKLTGDAAKLNETTEKLDADAAAIKAKLNTIRIYNQTTEEEILEFVKPAIKNGSTIEWENDFEKFESTTTLVGSITGTLKLTLNGSIKKVEVKKIISPGANGNRPEETKTDDKKDENTSASSANLNFTDVPKDAYFADAVKWAVVKNITAGTSNTTFSPAATCTRAQIITFLWRAAGSPKPTNFNPYSDVNENDYYYNAARWASEKGMVSGNTFAAHTPCTRASTVTYLWILADEPEADTSDLFADVSENADYAEAVAWAVEEGITSGTSATQFSPDTVCNRGQIATFLYRAFN